MAEMLQYGKEVKSLLRRILDVLGMYGLDHLWMYDNRSIRAKMKKIEFENYQVKWIRRVPISGKGMIQFMSLG